MQTCELNSFKVRTRKLLTKRKPLVREMEVEWNREVPKETGVSSAWSLLAQMVRELSPYLDPSLNGKLSKTIRNRDVKGYLMLGAELGSPQLYGSPADYFSASSVLNLLKKFPWADNSVDPLQNAIVRFREAEKLCARTNRRLRHYRNFDFASRPLVKRLGVHQVFHLARRKIQSWIGEFKFEGLMSYAKFGPGGVVGLNRPYTTPYYKFSMDGSTVSTGAYFYAAQIVTTSDTWVRSLALEKGLIDWNHPIGCIPYETKLRLYDHKVEIANYNKVTFVPKNALTHRAIAVEPSFNVMVQLAAGSYFRDCLRRAGCDLRDQTRNQDLAYVGSIQNDPYDPVTLDLSMASDTVSIEVVRELLPREWFEFLDNIRSHKGRFRGEEFKWEKFSSMGNGFTFELESMIFYALAQSVSDLNGTTEWFRDTFGPHHKYVYVSIYGDDIIVPSRDQEHLVRILNFCGFSLNLEKSFVTGPFRESCGKDYYNGVPVRCFYLSRDLSHVKDLIHLLNNLKASPISDYLPLTKGLIESWIPATLKKHLRGPHMTLEDSYIWSDPDDCHQSHFVVWDTDMQTWTYPTFKPRPTLRRGNLNWRYCQFLYSNTGVKDAKADSAWSQDQFFHHISGGGSAGDVVLSGTSSQGDLALAT